MIGVFDSGYGGLAILKSLLKELPQYDYMYLGDNLRVPYGNREVETIMAYTEEGTSYLFKQGCNLIIVACNTASEKVLRHLQEKYLRAPKVTNRKILGIIKPQVEAAVKLSKTGRIGVVATRTTIYSKSYETEIHKLQPDAQVLTQACPLLVPLIEEGWHQKPEARMIVKKYLQKLKSQNPDTLILACTHYVFLEKEFQRIMGKNVHVLDSGTIVAKSLTNYLERHPEISSELTATSRRTFLTTGDAEKFQTMGSKFLGQKIENVQRIIL